VSENTNKPTKNSKPFIGDKNANILKNNVFKKAIKYSL
jgi:hypothetical protein